MTTYTFNFNLEKIDYSVKTWHEREWANLDIIDGVLASLSAAAAVGQYYAVATGLVNTFAVAYTGVASYTTGLVAQFKANLANTGAATLNINGLGAKALQRNGVALTAGQIPINQYVKAVYDGTQFQVIEPRDTSVTIADGSVTAAKLSTGAMTWDASGNLTVTGTLSASGALTAASLKEGTKRAFVQNDSATFPSNKITFSTADPSGGSDGDIWIKHAA